MLIDYLRYQAFSGDLREFFEERVLEYADPSHLTGQHLRFAPEWVGLFWEYSGYRLMEAAHDVRHSRDSALIYILNQLGVRRVDDEFACANIILGEKPPTHEYKVDRKRHELPRLEIILDIDPNHWSEKYSGERSYQDIPIRYRRSGPARANLGSGNRLVDKLEKRGGYGTLCGTFKTEDGRDFGLTCGHVTRDRGDVLLERTRRFWGIEWGSTFSSLGRTRHRTVSGPEVKAGQVTTQLDAALIERNQKIKRSQGEAVIDHAVVKSIASVVQEDPVYFRGASRARATAARVSAVTVLKSIDLFNDGNLHSVGDVLMLGHRERMYIVQPVSRPGDSGSAVRFGFPDTDFVPTSNQWYGMVLGGDEHSAYASHAECIWAWAANVLSSRNLDFYY